jgi:hypothetical protein
LRVRETLADLDAGRPPRYWVDTVLPPVGTSWEPTLEDLDQWYATEDLAPGVAIDIECAGEHLRGIGFCPLSSLRPLWVPFRKQGGLPYWETYEQLYQAVEWVQRLLADPLVTKVWHNGLAFDISYLEGVGFEVVGPHADTILLAHTHQPEMPKSLQWLSTYHLGSPNWKQLSDTDDEMDK